MYDIEVPSVVGASGVGVGAGTASGAGDGCGAAGGVAAGTKRTVSPANKRLLSLRSSSSCILLLMSASLPPKNFSAIAQNESPDWTV